MGSYRARGGGRGMDADGWGGVERRSTRKVRVSTALMHRSWLLQEFAGLLLLIVYLCQVGVRRFGDFIVSSRIPE